MSESVKDDNDKDEDDKDNDARVTVSCCDPCQYRGGVTHTCVRALATS